MSANPPPLSISTIYENPITFALGTQEIILDIFHALIQRHPFETRTSWSSLLQCMLVNKQWCKLAQSILWRHLGTPKIALDTVIHQFELSKDGQPGMSLEDLYFRQPHAAFVRFRHYTSLVESIAHWQSDRASDEAFCTVLSMTGLRGRVYPLLRTVNLLVDPEKVWFPLCFRTRLIKDLTLQRIPVENPRPWAQDQPPREVVPLLDALQEVAQYCPSLTRLYLPEEILPVEMEYLQTLPFASLQKIALTITPVQTSDFIQMLLDLPRITQVGLDVYAGSSHALGPLSTNYSMHALPNLHALLLRIPAGSDYSGSLFRHFPRTPGLKELDVSDVTIFGRTQADELNSILRPMETFLRGVTLSSLFLRFTRATAPFREETWRKVKFGQFHFTSAILQPSLQKLRLCIFHYRRPTFEELAAVLKGLKSLRELKFEFQAGMLYDTREFLPMQVMLQLLPLLPRLEMLEVHTDGRRESNPLIWTKTYNEEEEEEDGEAMQVDEEWTLNEEIGEQYLSESLKYWWFLDYDRTSSWHRDQVPDYKEVLKRVAPNLSLDCGEQFEKMGNDRRRIG